MMASTKSNTRATQLERFSQFIGEVGRRRVWRTAIAYAAFVFVLLQLGEIVFPAFGAPDWALRILVVACFLGFPLVLALAWAFDITSGGIQRTHSDASDKAVQVYSGTNLPRLTLLAVIVMTVGGVGWWAVQDTLRSQVSTAPLGSDATNADFTAAAFGDDAPLVRSLAVLPLDDFSEEEGGEYFTAGFHEELISQLSQIGTARVISRTSVVQYDATGKAMPTIAQDLGVEGVVEGSVFRDGNRVRITVQLIHGPTDQHLWANSYDGTLEDAIGLQRTVAQAIAREIQADLFPDEEWETPGSRVASSAEVQDEYMKGRYAQSRATPEAIETAIYHFETAVQEDSSFAPAYAGLAGARFLQWVQSEDSLTDDLLENPGIVEPLEMAFKLDGESPEAQAVFLTLQESLGEAPDIELPEGVTIVGDSASLLEADLVLAGTEFGRQLQRVVVQHGLEGGVRIGLRPGQRLATARRLEAAREFESAEALVRAAIEADPESEEAWDALEELRAIQRDFQGVAEVREERATKGPRPVPGRASHRELEARIAEAGTQGFWSWHVEELESKRADGQRVSPVLMARAYLSVQREEEAFEELEAAIAERDRNLVSLWTDPAWDSVRADPRFREILAEARKARKDRKPGLW
jgi:TolB-like protein